MNIHDFLEEMKSIQSHLLVFIEEDNDKDNFQNLIDKFEEIKIHDDPHKLMALLHLITKIANNHHRTPNFFNKIDQILQIFLDDIKNYYPNTEIFRIFKSNKRILLFLIEQQIINFDEHIVKKITTTSKYIKYKYPQYFAPEIKPFINEKWFPTKEQNKVETPQLKYRQKWSTNLSKKVEQEDINWIDEISENELPDNFYEARKNGENDSYICELIRTDSVEEFIIHVTRNNYSLNSKITPSIYETNSLLLKQTKFNDLTLIEYASFYGSIQIFQYLKMNEVELKPLLWIFVIHSQNPELIHRLEENQVEPPFSIKSKEKSYSTCIKESIKCFHNDIMNYIQDNLLENKDNNSHDFFIQSIKCYNFAFIQEEFINESSFFDFCYYDHYLIVKALFAAKGKNIDINKIINK